MNRFLPITEFHKPCATWNRSSSSLVESMTVIAELFSSRFGLLYRWYE